MDKMIAKVLVGLPLEGPFDYKIPASLRRGIRAGCRVWVQFGLRRMVGYVVGFSAASRLKQVKPIVSLIDKRPILDGGMLKFTRAFADYYCCTWSQAIEAVLPQGIRKGKEVTLTAKKKVAPRAKEKFSAMVVHNCGHQKYWRLITDSIRSNLNRGRTVLFLVPDKELFDNRLQLLKEAFNKSSIALWDVRQGPKKQLSEWQKMKGGQADIVLGMRSAVFVPLPNPGLVIVEEEDNSAYKNEQGPFYHLREVALMRCRQEKTQLIITSRVPSVEAMHLAVTAKFKLISSKDGENFPLRQVVDLSQYRGRRDKSVFSMPLQEGISRTLQDGKKVILFINRKGFSTFLRCRKCGFSLKCPRCNVSLTYHYDKNQLICRYCRYQTEPSQLCPQCNSDYIGYLGRGIEKIESEAHRLFPGKKILRVDSDKKRGKDNFDMLIATQIILKEPSVARADLVAALEVDNLLNRLDFRAAEKTFSILTRLSLLAKERLIIQTYNREHYAIQAAIKDDFAAFYKEELKIRRGLGFPPFSHFVSVGLRGRTEERVKNAALALWNILSQDIPAGVEIFEAQPDMPAKLRGNFRWYILLKGNKIKKVNNLIKSSLRKLGGKSGIIISVNVDI